MGCHFRRRCGLDLLVAELLDDAARKTLHFVDRVDVFALVLEVLVVRVVVVGIVVVLQATGGLVVALVMRHAGNILKCFAVSISMCNCAVFTCLVSSEQTSVSTLVMGLALVVTATFAYST